VRFSERQISQERTPSFPTIAISAHEPFSKTYNNGVFADASLIAIHEIRTSAEAHCQRLIHKQAEVTCPSASPLRRR
jgi:hypothetical protein